MKVTDSSSYRLLLSNLRRNEATLQELYLQGSTQKKLNKASDNPAVLQPLLNIRTQITLGERYVNTMGTAADTMESTDGYLDSIENIMQRAKEIAINGVNDGMNSSDWNTLANEVSELKKQLLDVSNTQIDGKYIFAGYSVDETPFVENPDYDPALYDESDMSTWPVLYTGDSNNINLEINEGEFLDTNITGNSLFLGIGNQDFADGVKGLSSAKWELDGLTPSSPAGDIVIQNGDQEITIDGSLLEDTDGNYAQKIAGLLEGGASGGENTGLSASVSSASHNLGADPAQGKTQYSLSFETENGATVSVDIDNSATGKPVSLEQIQDELNKQLQNAGSDISCSTSDPEGELVLTGLETGEDFEITQSIDGGAPQSTTAYGKVEIVPNSATDVTLSGAGLTDIGLTSDADKEIRLDKASSGTDIFGRLTQLEEALRAGNLDDPDGPGGGVKSHIDTLEAAAEQNRVLRSQLGVKASRVEESITAQKGALTDLAATLSSYQDADMTQVLSEIVRQETALQANLSIAGRISSISILDYL